MTLLPRVRSGLLRHALDKQVLVYDSHDGLVHLLDPATACVMELLEEGVTDAGEIAEQIAIRLDVPRNEEFLPLALDELRKANMLDLSEAGPLEPLIDVNRREMIRKMALTGAAAMLVPAVATLTASPGYAQGTVPNVGPGGACTSATQCMAAGSNCCNRTCQTDACAPPTVAACGVCSSSAQCMNDQTCVNGACGGNSTTVANGQACNGHGNCCSNNCGGTAQNRVCLP
ncbi:MAG: hypothetical protein M3R07_01325 [Gemmatimonadota bacterium]|nr:hypothetical protein [Gemmatimonadota bacterium]